MFSSSTTVAQILRKEGFVLVGTYETRSEKKHERLGQSHKNGLSKQRVNKQYIHKRYSCVNSAIVPTQLLECNSSLASVLRFAISSSCHRKNLPTHENVIGNIKNACPNCSAA